MAKIAIIYYSTYGHIATLAESVKEGVESVPGVTAEIYQVPETLPEEVLAKLHAAPKKDHAIATVDVLKEADGILFGFPTRFGSLPAQVKAFFDSCGGLWAAGALVGKPAGSHLPLGYRAPELFNMDEIHGGSPWGAGTLANGDGSRQPSKLELKVATTQGKSFAEVTKKLAA
ncbi:hypothetical protein PR003_g27497 [Phytophthora rubi]|uniref:Flavodoxin-like domain-containing protein n=1 Tax=Phytophthora rubi TaxID=129364 RepID=A0A6A4BZ17_9STRA|nr:hypothetical protein PR003_g27497 [Phytophthora rubi]